MSDPVSFFDPTDPIGRTSANLPHWTQDGRTYFVTFRLVDSMPQEVLRDWRRDRALWISDHPAPWSEEETREFRERFTWVLERWLDQGIGSCLLRRVECRQVVGNVLRHFNGKRYRLGEYVVASNHVHAIVTPYGRHKLSEIIHSWKGFSGKQLLKDPEVNRCMAKFWLDREARRPIWQKEYFDHIVRSPDSLRRFEYYIRKHAEFLA